MYDPIGPSNSKYLCIRRCQRWGQLQYQRRRRRRKAVEIIDFVRLAAGTPHETSPKLVSDSRRFVFSMPEKETQRKFRIGNFVFRQVGMVLRSHGQTELKISFLVKFGSRYTDPEICTSKKTRMAQYLGSPKNWSLGLQAFQVRTYVRTYVRT